MAAKEAQEAKAAQEARAAKEAIEAQEAQAASEAKAAEEAREAERVAKEAIEAQKAQAANEAKAAEEAKEAEMARAATAAKEAATMAQEARAAKEAKEAKEANEKRLQDEIMGAASKLALRAWTDEVHDLEQGIKLVDEACEKMSVFCDPENVWFRICRTDQSELRFRLADAKKLEEEAKQANKHKKLVKIMGLELNEARVKAKAKEAQEAKEAKKAKTANKGSDRTGTDDAAIAASSSTARSYSQVVQEPTWRDREWTCSKCDHGGNEWHVKRCDM